MQITGLHPKVSKVLAECETVAYADLQDLIDSYNDVLKEGQTCPDSVAVDAPVYCAGHWFWRPTIAFNWAMDKMDGVCRIAKERELLTALMLVHCHVAIWLRTLHATNYQARLYPFIESLTVTTDEVMTVVEALFLDFPRITTLDAIDKRRAAGLKVDKDLDMMATPAQMMEAFGQTITYWVFSVSIQAVVWMARLSVPADNADGTKNGDHPAMAAHRAWLVARKLFLLKYGRTDGQG